MLLKFEVPVCTKSCSLSREDAQDKDDWDGGNRLTQVYLENAVTLNNASDYRGNGLLS